MVDIIYIEDEVADHPRTLALLERFPKATRIPCRRYTEVFNLRAQNFRLQKKRPAMILAKKHGTSVLPTPPEYNIGADRNYYFSHMLNCLYDCRYCFLQGMYQSAHYVLFVNFEDFETEIDDTLSLPENEGRQLCFFSGYDCDSLAMESVTGFADHFLPFFEQRPQAWLELRSKSINTAALSRREPLPNVIVSFTLSPDVIAREVEHGAPSLERRLNRVQSLTVQGWVVGLRFDPLIPWPDYQSLYPEFFDKVFSQIPPESVHSATLGPMRFPSAMYDRIVKLYPDDKLFARFPFDKKNGQATFPPAMEEELVNTVGNALSDHLPPGKIFSQNQPETTFSREVTGTKRPSA